MRMRGSGLVRIVFVCASVALTAHASMRLALAQETADSDNGDASRAAPRQIAIVAHPDNPVDELTKAELGRLFLKKRAFWSDGTRCVPIDQPGSSDLREGFYRIVLDLDQTELKRYWMQETMTGNARPPVTVDNAAIAKKYIEKLTGAVAYIWADEVDESVKIVLVRDVPEFAVPKSAADTPDDPKISP